jgi:hypothetical protein
MNIIYKTLDATLIDRLVEEAGFKLDQAQALVGCFSASLVLGNNLDLFFDKLKTIKANRQEPEYIPAEKHEEIYKELMEFSDDEGLEGGFSKDQCKDLASMFSSVYKEIHKTKEQILLIKRLIGITALNKTNKRD